MSNLIIILYFLTWLLTLAAYQHRKQRVDAGSVIICSYTGYAFLSIILWNYSTGEYYNWNELKILPFVYLYIMLRIALSPVTHFDQGKISKVVAPNMNILHAVSLFIIATTFLSLPSIIEAFQAGNVSKLLTDQDMGAELYSETAGRAEDSGSGVENIAAIFSGAFSDIAMLLLFYYLTLEKKHKWIIAGLSVSCLLLIAAPIVNGERSSVIIMLLTIIVAYFLMRKYLTQQLRKWIEIAGISVIIAIFIPILAITISRFDNREGGTVGSMIYYTGQCNLNFNNYGLDAGCTRHGERTFNLLLRAINPDTPKNYIERRDKYPNLKMDDNIFYTFVGDFTLDFGPWIAALIIIAFSLWVLWQTKPKEEDKAEFHQLLLIYLVACICMQGGFYLFAYSDTQGLKLITLLCLYVLCKYTKPETCQD